MIDKGRTRHACTCLEAAAAEAVGGLDEDGRARLAIVLGSLKESVAWWWRGEARPFRPPDATLLRVLRKQMIDREELEGKMAEGISTMAPPPSSAPCNDDRGQ